MADNVIPRSVSPGTVCDCALMSAGVATQTPGSAIQVTASVTGTVVLTLWSGATITVNPQVGDSIYPYQVKSYTAGTATVTACYSLYT